MSSPAFDELQQRLQRIEQNLNQVGILLVPSEINAGIKQAIVLTTVYADSALASARKVLDFIASDLYQREFKRSPGTQPLENKLRELEKAGILPRRLAAYAANVRELGNLGAHGNPTEVTADDVVSSLENLMKLVAWYCEQVRPSSIPEPPPDPPPVPPVVMTISPQGMESWTAGTRQAIAWSISSGAGAAPIERTVIELCVGSGQRVLVIASESRSFLEPGGNRASYWWEVPGNLMPGADYSVKVTVFDRAGQAASASSPGFSVRARHVPYTPPPLPYAPPPLPPPPASAVGPRGFSAGQIVVATLLGLVAGPLLFAWNDLKLGKKLRALIIALVALGLNGWADQMGPGALALVLPGALVMWFVAKAQQGGSMRAGRPIVCRGGTYWWAAITVGLVVFFLQVAALNNGFE